MKITDYNTSHVSINRVHMGLVLGMLDSETVSRSAAQDPSEWQELAAAEQARREAL